MSVKTRPRMGFNKATVVGLLAVVGWLVFVAGCNDDSSSPATNPEHPVLGGDVSPPPWRRTEERVDCTDYDGLRRPYFGEQHIHTSFSFDAFTRGQQSSGPREAYDFARGGTISLPDAEGGQTRTASTDRPLDWLMVSDHAEFMGETRECIIPESGAYNRAICRDSRNPFVDTQLAWTFLIASGPAPVTVQRPRMCTLPGIDCEASLNAVWVEIQGAAEEAYDRSAACSFTSFVGYEFSPDIAEPLVVNFPYRSSTHHNLMFRNHVVPDRPVSAIDLAIDLQNAAGGPVGDALTSARGVNRLLWDYMDACNDAGSGCEVLSIPHNSNLSSGLMWWDPADAEDAARRRRHEPVVEVFQQKGGSECRFDRLAGAGVGTADELCTFEQQTERSTIGRGQELAVEDFPFPRDYARNALKDGLVFEELLGVNPFEFGLVGSTDNHNATAGLTTEDEEWPGMRGTEDAAPANRITLGSIFERSPGGLAVAWAEENTRDAIFMAFRRREVYATSGNRPIVRFFAGDLDDDLCRRSDLVEVAYRQGVPMGSVLGAVRGDDSPRFLVHAMKDAGGGRLAPTDLQRVQIIKGWIDASGRPQERVFEVAGDPDNGATVDRQTCEPVGKGFADLCAVWEDPDFDPAQRAFYYARVIDNPTCRWSTHLCQSLGVNPFSPSCDAEATATGSNLTHCCLREEEERFYSPIVQERAWSSPIWYKPDGVSHLSAQLVRDAGDEHLQLSMGWRQLSSSVDPAATALAIRIADDDVIYSVHLPAGTLSEAEPGTYRFDDPSGAQFGGLRTTSVSIGETEARLDVEVSGLDLSRADLSDHFVTVEVELGSLVRSHTRLWSSDGERILKN